MGHPLRNVWQEKFDRVRSGHGAMTSEEVQPPTDFFKEIVFSATQVAAINRNGDIMHDLGQHKTTSDR